MVRNVTASGRVRWRHFFCRRRQQIPHTAWIGAYHFLHGSSPDAAAVPVLRLFRAVRASAAGLLPVGRRDLGRDPPRDAPRGHRRPPAVPLHVHGDRHLEHPRARRREPHQLLQDPGRLPQRLLPEDRRRQHQVQPRAHVAEVVRLPQRRQQQLRLHRLPPPVPLQLVLQLVAEQQPLRDRRRELDREADLLQRGPRRRQRRVPRQLQLAQHRLLAGLGRATSPLRARCSTWTCATKAATTE